MISHSMTVIVKNHSKMSKKENVFVLFDQGKRPSDPEVKELGIKSATLYRYFQSWKNQNPSMIEKNHSMTEKPNHTMTTLPTKPEEKVATFIRVVPRVQIISYTPIMQRAQEAAFNEFGWSADMSLEDFLDTVLYYYFKRKGISLEAYVVEKPAEAKKEA